ncbi:LysR family transcriptional regulator [Occallatibacter riparius]|uniref:LysR family transcriptional regulator n=1 Tax=Occallatibacter riparius TaxID=1002689 RepID=A0A9J7BT64_9BACT|nr:LysR family transcriptional regulator [Occallatibacter riparius]UWZ84205.1 LysR family transcriptional regulator [Occallatibacter riparius]
MRFLADLALFVEVANTRNFGRAATALGMPASTLSRRISVLERELGVQLIHRSSRVFTLTDAGQSCYEQAKSLVAEAKRIQEGVAGSASQASGHIRVGVPFDLAQTIFVPLFSRYIRANPQFSVEVFSISGHPNLLTESLDLAIWVGHQLRLPDSSFWSRRIGTFARRLFASKEYLARHKKIQEPQQLTEHSCLCFMHGEALSQWDLYRGREHKSVKVGGAASANSVGMLARFAKEGMGIVLASDFLASHPGFGDGLVRVLGDWEATPAHLFAVTPSELQPERVRKLVSFMNENFEQALLEVTSHRK